MFNFFKHRGIAVWFATLIWLTGCTQTNIKSQPVSTQGVSDFPELISTSTVDSTIVKEGSSFIIIPESELVNSPSTIGFNIHEFVQSKNGTLNQYSEEVNGAVMSGSDIVTHLSQEYSVNPRILLALLEQQSHWVTRIDSGQSVDFPLGIADPDRKGLYRQLSWAANTLNRGFYLRKVNGLNQLTLTDGQKVDVNTSLGPATAAVQFFYSQLLGFHDWQVAVSPLGVYTTYVALFGDPSAHEISSLIPADLSQPPLQLPFAKGYAWSFTSGPHSAWGDGAAWAALDFSPPDVQYGCSTSKAWVVAAADGLIVRSENGMVVQDLDGDGYEQTGWTILYMHIATRDRVPFGATLSAGDRIGHPSCEGGPSSGTHVHIARRYNGEWIPADQTLPFNLDGWISQGMGKEYDGNLIRNGVIVEALGYYSPQNQITR